MKDELALPENPYDDLGFLFWQIMKAWQRNKQKLLDKFGITSSQMEILSAVHHLGREDEEITQIAIANLTNIDPMTTSTILRNLQKKKLIIRKSSEIDTRARTVAVTDEGYELLVKAVNELRTASAETFKDIDQKVLRKELGKLFNVLTELNK